MRLGFNLPLVCHNSQTQLTLACFLLTLKYVMTAECSYSVVAKAKPCFGPDDLVKEQDCRRLSEECCVYKKSGVFKKCLRTKEKQPSRGSCNKASILQSKQALNQFLEGDVFLELKVVSELHCWDCCMRYKQCKAYNYQHAIGRSLKNCQLLSSDVGLLIPRKGHTYNIIHLQQKDSQEACVVEGMGRYRYDVQENYWTGLKDRNMRNQVYVALNDVKMMEYTNLKTNQNF